jgi:hypothetical protein
MARIRSSDLQILEGFFCPHVGQLSEEDMSELLYHKIFMSRDFPISEKLRCHSTAELLSENTRPETNEPLVRVPLFLDYLRRDQGLFAMCPRSPRVYLLLSILASCSAERTSVMANPVAVCMIEGLSSKRSRRSNA